MSAKFRGFRYYNSSKDETINAGIEGWWVSYTDDNGSDAVSIPYMGMGNDMGNLDEAQTALDYVLGNSQAASGKATAIGYGYVNAESEGMTIPEIKTAIKELIESLEEDVSEAEAGLYYDETGDEFLQGKIYGLSSGIEKLKDILKKC